MLVHPTPLDDDLKFLNNSQPQSPIFSPHYSLASYIQNKQQAAYRLQKEQNLRAAEKKRDQSLE